ncbi:sigma-E processing peptidase SpoIIGA [Aminipila terrae]|uniref:Sporulation sigma-E factor-processing peptidase n=1 Tax=Aminipila terrae TaxID=2697030 RepID=A0A6P1MJB8_9FIRM|nr:sigma-E processing peptidase SpoIIGA [Aminipila terrae]QHI73293.1 hypothetical protein Ami3637_13705 [Aminipila terrae]
MEIYGEYLFAENFLMGILILYLSSKIANLPTSKKRLIAGGMLCGVFSFIIFVQNIGILLGILVKVLFSLLLAYVAFDRKIFKGTILIYIVSAFMGGMTIIILYIIRIRGMTNNAVLYVGDITYMNVVFGAVVSYIIIMAFSKIITAKQLKERIFTDITIEIEGHTVTHRALIDSGNFLKEPLSGKAVAIISKSAAAKLKSMENIDFSKRYCLVPYNSIGMKNGILEGYRVDNAYVNNKALGSIIVAVYNMEFCKLGEEEYQMLLSKDFLLGGVA